MQSAIYWISMGKILFSNFLWFISKFIQHIYVAVQLCATLNGIEPAIPSY